jgi:hypothetical protein
MKTTKTCGRCMETKPLDQFYQYRHTHRGLGIAKFMAKCKACCRSVGAKYRERKGREFFREKNRVYQTNNRDKIRRLSRAFAEKLKAETFAAYGYKCNCCGENEIRFLSIDHISENGAEHRRQETGSKGHRNSGTGAKMYGWLKRHGFPKDNFQLLCANCNVGKHFNGGVCPHQHQYRNLRIMA